MYGKNNFDIFPYDKHLESQDLCQIMPSDAVRPRVIV